MNKKFITTILAAMLFTIAAGAQALVGSYFLDNSLYRNRLNPAFSPRANYFGLPTISSFGTGIYGNFGPADLLFPKNGELYLFLNNNVSSEEFAKRLTKYPSMDIDADFDLLNFGFYTKKNCFWSVDLGFKATGSVGIPRNLFMLLKDGMKAGDNVLGMEQFYVDANASFYAAVGHSRDLSKYVKGLKVGAKFRFYVSMAHAFADLGESTIRLSEDRWMVDANAKGVISSSFFKLKTAQTEDESPELLFDMNKIAPAGYGFSFDLGAEYRLSIGCPVDGLTFSFAALDLGGFFYKV